MSAFKYTLFIFVAVPLLSLLFLSDVSTIFGLLLGIILILVSYIDYQTFKIPDWLNGLILLCGIFYNIFIDEMWFPIISFLIAGSSFYLLAFIYVKFRGRQGLGGGDIKLFACGAVWLLPYYLPLVLLVSSISALIYSLLGSIFLKESKEKTAKIPFGPFLSLGIWFSFLFGENMLNFFNFTM